MNEATVDKVFAAAEKEGRAQHEVNSLSEIWAAVKDKFTEPNFTVHEHVSDQGYFLNIQAGTTGSDLAPEITFRKAFNGIFVSYGLKGEEAQPLAPEQVVKELGQFYGRNKNFVMFPA